MAKVMCALLRYTDGEKSLILEHEKLRQTVSDWHWQFDVHVLILF
jgi:hypothetical protein